MPAGSRSGHHPIAVVLDLVNPSRTRGRLIRGGWQARFDKPAGGMHTRKHWRFRCRNEGRESSLVAARCLALHRRLIQSG